jgi:hypothetical protein
VGVRKPRLWRIWADHVFAAAGFNEPNALAIIANDGSGDNHIFHLYVREKDPRAELWDGARSGTRAAVDVFNADEVRRSLLMGTYEHCTDYSTRRPATSSELEIFYPRSSRRPQRYTPTSPASIRPDRPCTDIYTAPQLRPKS